MDEIDDELLRTHRQELRRGTVVLASLLALRSPGYGYALLTELAGHDALAPGPPSAAAKQ